MRQHVLMGLLFYPRGGSAQCARYLTWALKQRGVPRSLVTGSLGPPGEETHAKTFFGDIDLHAVDYTPALKAAGDGRDSLGEPVPLHPSYEDRPGVADRILTAVSPDLAEHHVRAWQRILRAANADRAAIFHLHHLTPQHEAVMRSWPDRPIIAHLHGTEVKLLQGIADRMAVARALGTDLAGMPGRLQQGIAAGEADLDEEQQRILTSTRWDQWRYGEFWAERLRAIARACHRLIVISPYARDAAVRLLGIDPERLALIPNGVNTERFDARDLTVEARLALLREWLVEEPLGWDESGVPGSVRYREEDLADFIDLNTGQPYPVLLYVGRFMRMKRVPLLIRAYRRARPYFNVPAPLVIWGGNPGEWEGEHPYDVARQTGDDGIFFTGWRSHGDLALGLNCADVLVAPSVNEPFGQVYLEAMASGLPVIATRSGGPPSFINTRPGEPNGWLVDPDDEEALVQALIHAVNDPIERARRARNAYGQIRGEYAWESIAARVEQLYDEVLDEQRQVGVTRDAHTRTLQSVRVSSQRGHAARSRPPRRQRPAHHDPVDRTERRSSSDS